jgi:hypothetical protein
MAIHRPYPSTFGKLPSPAQGRPFIRKPDFSLQAPCAPPEIANRHQSAPFLSRIVLIAMQELKYEGIRNFQ